MIESLKVEGLVKQYSSFTLDKVSFILYSGRIMGLIGKNGAGKSTILKSILNLVTPNSGTITFFNLPFTESEIDTKNKLGVVLGGIDFYNLKKLKTITKITAKFYQKWDDKAYRKYMKEFEIDEEKRVKDLSSGMKVKYLIAVALSHNAELFIFDEPTSGLDPVAREDLLTLFKQLVKSGTRSILFSTHIIADLERCADDITYLKDGKILKSSTKEDFLKAFQVLKTTPDERDLGLEDIMLRIERNTYNDETFK